MKHHRKEFAIFYMVVSFLLLCFTTTLPPAELGNNLETGLLLLFLAGCFVDATSEYVKESAEIDDSSK